MRLGLLSDEVLGMHQTVPFVVVKPEADNLLLSMAFFKLIDMTLQEDPHLEVSFSGRNSQDKLRVVLNGKVLV